MEKEQFDIGPKEAIEKSGFTLTKLSQITDLDYKTVLYAKNKNKWPAQRRTRRALRHALGLTEDEL